MSKVILLCLSSLLVQVYGQSLAKAYNAAALAEGAPLFNAMGYNPMASIAPNGLAYDAALANGLYGANGISNGGGFVVSSSSPIAASGITVQSDNLVIEGPLAVSGQIPFLGVVAVEGPLPAIGQGSVAYGCGNGNVGIISEVEPGQANALPVDVGVPGVNNGAPKRVHGPLY